MSTTASSGQRLVDELEQCLGVPGLADDLEARVLEQRGDPLPQQDRVVGEHDAHRRRPRNVPLQRRKLRLEPGCNDPP